MQKYNHIKSLLKLTGLQFIERESAFSSHWKLYNKEMIEVIVAVDIHPEWVHILCNVGSINNYMDKVQNHLLRLNNMSAGLKFSLEKNQNIVCSSELWYATISEDHLKQQITQVVKMVTQFYERIEKENLKLNSA